MSTPNFRRGVPATSAPTTQSDGTWPAKYDGRCDYCGGEIFEGDRVKWNLDSTKVVHADHR